MELLIGPSIVAGSGFFGIAIAQAAPISEETGVSIALVASVIGFAFWFGTKLTNIQRDIRDVKSDLKDRPCMKKEDCPVNWEE